MPECEGRRVYIIGAGASGLMAAVSAAGKGASVTVFEHMREAGIKLALTGNGKCNFTNTGISPEHYHSADSLFVRRILDAFSFNDCLTFFERLGIHSRIRHFEYDDLGYAYPEGMDAAQFRDRLYSEALRLGVKFVFGFSADRLIPLFEDSGSYDAFILAAGSNAYPATGSDSSVYPLIKKTGIRFNTFTPALCALFSKNARLKELKGQRVRETAELRISDARGTDSHFCYGEIQFNEHSISGIPVMQLSGYAAAALKQQKKTELVIGQDEFEIYRTAGFDRAQVCSGGIDISEIDPLTMRLKRYPQLYVCGEMMDVYGDCGGFNLHFAWATGYIAGTSAAAGNAVITE